jgi:transcriptional regulator with XRE-family HTH domain
LSINLYTPTEVAERLATRMMNLRLALNMKRATLGERAGVSASTIKRFESTGQITLENLLKLAQTLGCLDQFEALLDRSPVTSLAELERRAEASERRRGRR